MRFDSAAAPPATEPGAPEPGRAVASFLRREGVLMCVRVSAGVGGCGGGEPAGLT